MKARTLAKQEGMAVLLDDILKVLSLPPL